MAAVHDRRTAWPTTRSRKWSRIRIGSLWIGYRDAYGITHLTFSSGDKMGEVKIEPSITQANGLRSDKTLFLPFDARGWLWVGTDHGVDVFDRTRWRHYGRSDGLIWDDLQYQRFLRRCRRQRVDRHQPRPFALPAGGDSRRQAFLRRWCSRR